VEEKELQKEHNSLRAISRFGSHYGTFLWKGNPQRIYSILVKSSAGFTLIEIITAVGVLAILASVTLAAVNPLEQYRKAQDSRRKSDLSQVQKALEAYYQDFERYPASSTGQIVVANDSGDPTKEWGSSWTPYLEVLPIDPNSLKQYSYWADTDGQTYRLYTSLDRGTKDPASCASGAQCNALPLQGVSCGTGATCNYGVTSPNVSP